MRLKQNRDYNTKDYDKLKISDLKRLTDYWFRKYLLKKAKRKGSSIYCPIKKRYFTEDKIHVAHYYGRNVICLRYSEDNCHLISSLSNMFDALVPDKDFKSKHHKEYYNYLLKEKGESFLENLLQESKKICIFGRTEYVELIKKFRDE